MKTKGLFWLVAGFVPALFVVGCTYDVPTVEVALGGSGGASSSSGEPMGPVEDCLDGIDNDEDGAIDCADADCTAGFTCLEIIPDGWTRVILQRGNGIPPAATPCADGTTPELLFTDPAGPAECAACSCGPLAGTTCNLPGLLCFQNSATCAGTALDLTSQVVAAECSKPDLGGAATISCQLYGKNVVNEMGECAPSIADFPNKDPWLGWVRACPFATAEGGGGCVGGACIPKPEAGFSTCIRKTGTDICPAGWNGVEAYASVKDERGCAACSCTPSARCGQGGYEFYDFDFCQMGGAGFVTILDETCTDGFDLPDLTTWSIRQVPPVGGGSCLPAGGEATGAVVPLGPVTFCCQ